ncbi:hypothetical protein M9Y10_014581 [Tritrichomonas musculus]|uniref:F5/8 type C domain-containing protein n=1 Tax=Tritrichomonas musculus TaxID=1915356 RepID=A0ABR2L038_9EUKA
MNKISIQLKTSSILNVPLQIYDDFLFIVNGEEFKTTRLVADLLSPKISQFHSIDPTMNEFTLNTNQKGDFSRILSLVNFENKEIQENELGFVSEVIDKLGNGKIDIYNDCEQINQLKITNENVFSLIAQHLKYPTFYSKLIEKEIDHISIHFFENEENFSQFKDLSFDIIELIISNPKLQIKDEDQLLSLVNELYMFDSKFAKLYEYVIFKNVTGSKMSEFIEIFNIYDITKTAWFSISQRLKQEIKLDFEDDEVITFASRYKEDNRKGRLFQIDPNKPFDGIINYLRKESNGNLESKIEITSTPIRGSRVPQNAILYEDQTKWFHSSNIENSWICFYFKDHRIVLKDYIIRSSNYAQNNEHPKSWVIEGSNDNSKWEICDEQKNCNFLNGNNIVHTFSIHNENLKEFRYIRMRQIDTNWRNDNDLSIDSFELYGKLI